MPYRPNPLSGDEIKKILRIKAESLIDNIPLLRVGNVFNFVEFSIGFVLSAFPKDVPVPPEKELNFSLTCPDVNIEELNRSQELVLKLENLRSEAERFIEKINEHLQNVNPQVEISEHIGPVTIPDQIRQDNNLPLKIDSHKAVDLEPKRSFPSSPIIK